MSEQQIYTFIKNGDLKTLQSTIIPGRRSESSDPSGRRSESSDPSGRRSESSDPSGYNSFCTCAVASGQLHILRWLRTKTPPYPWNEFHCLDIVNIGDLPMMQWILDHGSQILKQDTQTHVYCYQYKIGKRLHYYDALSWLIKFSDRLCDFEHEEWMKSIDQFFLNSTLPKDLTKLITHYI